MEINTNNIASLTTTVNNAITDFTAALTTTNDNVASLDTRVTTLEQNPGGGTDMSWRTYPVYSYMSNESRIPSRHSELYVCGTTSSNLSVYLKLYCNINVTGDNFALAPNLQIYNSYGIIFDLTTNDFNLVTTKAISVPIAINNAWLSGFLPVIKLADGTTTAYYAGLGISGGGISLQGTTSGGKFALAHDVRTVGACSSIADTGNTIFNYVGDSYVFIKLV